MTKDRKQGFADLPAPAQAGILCNDPRFQNFAAMRCGVRQGSFGQSAAAEYLRQICRIQSRRDLADNAAAAERFQALRTEFDAFTGKIASPRR
ncbi:MAG: hypothetical protein AB3N13_09140 [Arenibacterium sp.]